MFPRPCWSRATLRTRFPRTLGDPIERDPERQDRHGCNHTLPELPAHEAIVAEPGISDEFNFDDNIGDGDSNAARKALDRSMAANARTASLDPGDGIDL